MVTAKLVVCNCSILSLILLCFFWYIYITISHKEINIFKYSRKALLFYSNDIWIKTFDNPMLDVTMGTLDGAEICELFGLYILDKLSILLHMQNVRLYRHDGLELSRIPMVLN